MRSIRAWDRDGMAHTQITAASFVCASVRSLLHERLNFCAGSSRSHNPAVSPGAQSNTFAGAVGAPDLRVSVEVSLNAVDFDLAPGMFVYHDPVSCVVLLLHYGDSPNTSTTICVAALF
jgi:hypothetical protein